MIALVNTSAPVRAAFWMAGAMISFTAMAVGGRSLSGHLDTFEIMMYRSFVGIVLVIGFAYRAGTLGQVRTNRFRLHTIRNIFHFVGQNLWFYALALIPLSQLFAFEFTTPLWVAALAPFVLGEKWTITRLLTVVTGFVGILIVARPDTSHMSLALLAAALCAIGFAGTVLTTKLLSATESVTCILFWLVLLQALFGVVCAAIDKNITPLTINTFPWVLLVGVCGLLAHFCVTNALALAPATVVSPLEFLRLPLVSAVGYAFYGEPLLLSVFIGAAIILAANVLNIRAEAKSQQVLR